MEVEAMIEEVAVTGEEGISGQLNNFVEDRSGIGTGENQQ
jgi:hypothetical protein